MPWGAPRSGSVSATKRNYTGQYRDDTGLLYYHARYYDPVLGRFISPDTLVPDPTDPQDLNRYTYAKNNPMRYTDPTGHCWGIVSGLRTVPGYDVNCQNMDLALEIVQHPDASLQDKALAGGYVVAMGGAHVVAVAGTAVATSGAIHAAATGGGAAAAGAGGAATTATQAGSAAVTAVCADGDCANEVSKVGVAANTFTRALTQADLGIKGTLQQLKGTFSISEGTATVRIDMIEGNIANPLNIFRNLSQTAQAAGAEKLRIESFLANPALNDILIRRYGMQPGAGPDGADVIEIVLK